MKHNIFSSKFWKGVFNPHEDLEKIHNPETPQEEQLTPESQTPEPEFAQTEETREEDPSRQKTDRVNKTVSKAVKPRPTPVPSGASLISRSELNLEHNVVFTVSTYKKKSREVSTTQIGSGGEIIERRAIIGRTADGMETGVLTTHDFKLYLTLIQLWEEAGRPVNDPVHFTILRIINQLGMVDSGREYDRVKKWLRHLRQIPLTFINSFYIPDVAEHRDLADITILNHLHIYERKKTGKVKRTRGYGEFQFDRHLLQNLINNHSHPIRLDVINSFKKHKDLSILLYIYLDRNLAFKNKYEVGLEKLFEHLDLSQNYVKYPSHRKAKLEPVLEQIKGKELSTGILSYAQVLKTKDGRDYKLVCRKKPFPKRLREQESQPELAPPTEPEAEPMEPKPELIPLLTGKGLTEKQAAKLISEQQPEVIRTQLEYFPFRLKDYKAQEREINKPAILYDSIKENWKAPKGHLNAEKEKEREAKRVEKERIAQLEQEEQERQEKETAEFEAYKDSLDPETRAELREKALQEIKGMKNIKEGFITEILINFKENEILRSEDNNLP